MIPALDLLESMQSGSIPISPAAVDKIDKIDKTAPAALLPELCKTMLTLHDRMILLRCEEKTAKADRHALVSWISRQIDRLAERCGNPGGWLDPTDPFADGHQIVILRHELNELTATDAPYPLGPLSDDPFSMKPPRLYNGKLMH